jgi:hypothetical protein
MNVTYKKSSPWWEGFELFIPKKHLTLYKEYVLCKECSTFHKNPDAGIVKVGVSQSTSNLRAHKQHHHPAKYEIIAKHVDKIIQKSSEDGVLPTSIAKMPGFSTKLKVKDARLLYWTAAVTLAIEEGILFCTFSQPSFHCLFIPPNSESNKIVKLTHQEVRASVLEMGGFEIEATKREIRNHRIAWTTDHWMGADKGTYTTVTAHWINNATWTLHSACLDFKVFEGFTTGE